MTTVLVVVPGGRVDAARALGAALARHQPDWARRYVWAGDPQLRPGSPGDGGWLEVAIAELDLVRARPDAVPWVAATAALTSSLLADDEADGDGSADAGAVVVLVAGDIAVAGPLDDLVAPPGRLRFVPRVIEGLAEVDRPAAAVRRSPDLADLHLAGERWPSVASFGAGTRGAATWLAGHTATLDDSGFGRVLDQLAVFAPADLCRDPRVGVSTWRWADPPHLLVAPGFDAARPWMLDPDLDGTPRVSVASPDRQRVLADVADQFAGGTEPLRLPGAIDIDGPMRHLVDERDDVPGAPWSRAGEFRAWLDEHYWDMVVSLRDDVLAAFPHPQGVDAEPFRRWARGAAARGDAPLLVSPPTSRGAASRVVSADRRRDGVNLVGYFRHQSGVSNVGRRLAGILDRQRVPYTVTATERTYSPRIEPPPHVDQRLDFESSLCFVNGDQFGFLARDLPEVMEPGRKVVGLWSWELETLVDGPPVDTSRVDQIWATTTFMARPFRELDVPVHHVHIPFTEPQPSDRRRHEFPPLAAAGDRFVFGVVLDHLSITARKNPYGAVEAFRRAFAPGEGPLLVVKTINARIAWREHERLLAATDGRDDVVIWDHHLPIDDHVALIRSFDGLVSLHRSEGVGLHLPEAMWLERPVIATRYSGNLDFMDDDCALLVDAELVPVADGGWAYPATARWADPDLDQAAAAMRRLAGDPAFAAELGRRGRERVAAMPGEAALVERMVELLDLDLAP